MNTKQQLGQFFTTQSASVLQGFESRIASKNVVDPFAGSGDLLDWADSHGARTTSGYDIDPRYVDGTRVQIQDSLACAPPYPFVLTNPPYLYQNKMANNARLKNSKYTDLYHIALSCLLNSHEGIVIVPVNFISSENARYIREVFLARFEILQASYFCESSFDDTTYTVMVFYYRAKKEPCACMRFPCTIFPEGRVMHLELHECYAWQVGGDFLERAKIFGNTLGITRLEKDDIQEDTIPLRVAYNHLDDRRTIYVDAHSAERVRRNILLLKAIDTGSANGTICLEDIRVYGLDALISLKTSRNQIFLLMPETITVHEQECLILLFNEVLNDARTRYHSLFMTNFRDKNRKRISFHFAYCLLNYLYFTKLRGADHVKEQYALF